MSGDDPNNRAVIFLAQGDEARARGELELAWGWLQKARALARSQADPRLLANASRRLAELCAGRGDLEEAIRLAQESRQGAEAAWSRPDLAAADALLGRLRVQHGEVDAGLRSLHLAVDMWGELGQVEEQIRCWRQIGVAHAERGELEAARGAWGRCLAALQHRRDLAAQADLHAEIAAMCARAGEVDLAITHALAALGRHRHLQDAPAVASDLAGLLELRGTLGGTAFRQALARHLDREGLLLVEALLDDEDARLHPPPPPPLPAAPPLPAPDGPVSAAEEALLAALEPEPASPDAEAEPRAGGDPAWRLPEAPGGGGAGEPSAELQVVSRVWQVLMVMFGMLVLAVVIGGVSRC